VSGSHEPTGPDDHRGRRDNGSRGLRGRLEGKEELGFAVFLLAVGIYILATTGSINVPGTGSTLGPRFFPYVVGGLLVVISLALAVEVLRGHRVEPEAGEDVDTSMPTDWRTLGTIAAVFIAFIVLIEPLGFVLSTAILFAGVAWSLGARRPARLAAISLTVALVVYLGFDRLLGITLPNGVLEWVL
jgi:putative tricarboxylic transport membrane protein